MITTAETDRRLTGIYVAHFHSSYKHFDNLHVSELSSRIVYATFYRVVKWALPFSSPMLHDK